MSAQGHDVPLTIEVGHAFQSGLCVEATATTPKTRRRRPVDERRQPEAEPAASAPSPVTGHALKG